MPGVTQLSKLLHEILKLLQSYEMDQICLEDGITNMGITEESTESLLNSLLHRADDLLRQFRDFQTFLQQNRKAQDFEARIFRRGIESEVKSLHALTHQSVQTDLSDLDSHKQQSKRLHVLRSSNLPFYEAIWTTAKSSRGVRSLGKRVYYDGSNDRKRSSHVSKATAKSALVDLVSNDGLAWTKVSIVTEKRLLFDMAKEGWEVYGPDSDGADEEDDLGGKMGKLELVRLAEDLQDAARSERICYKHPTVYFVLPRLIEGKQKEIDAMIADIRATGAVVQCGPFSLPQLHTSDLASSQFSSMLPTSQLPPLTPTLNIDCTILLALISDISHHPRLQLPPSPTSRSGHYHTAILKQIEAEEKSPLLPNEIYPALATRKLVCTDLAAQRMREIVNTMGTSSERSRADILLGEGEYLSQTPEALRIALGALSSHDLPGAMHLPIEVVSHTSPSQPSSAPAAAAATITSPLSLPNHKSPSPSISIINALTTSLNLSPINTSVFTYGWQHDIVTITSNRVVASQIEKGVNEILDARERKAMIRMDNNKQLGVYGGDDLITVDVDGADRDLIDQGPKLWVCEGARSLIGKDKMNGLRP